MTIVIGLRFRSHTDIDLLLCVEISLRSSLRGLDDKKLQALPFVSHGGHRSCDSWAAELEGTELPKKKGRLPGPFDIARYTNRYPLTGQ